MYFKISTRNNPATKQMEAYYRLVESYRNEYGRVCHRTILNVGYWSHVVPEKLNKIQKQLTERAGGKIALFGEEDPQIRQLTQELWDRLILEKRIDLPEQTVGKREKLVDIGSIKHRDVREVGAEWLSYQALEQLQIPELLRSIGWEEEQTQLAITQIISRAVYPSSEYKTSRWIKENSAICELSGYPLDKLTKDKLYQSALALYDVKDILEQGLSKRTNELFDLQDKIMLFDLTNTYFEGEKRNSKLAQYGRSKEKRNDAKLVVLAMVVNPEGFLKYSNIYEGNTADCKTLPDIVDQLSKRTGESGIKGIVVMDAGIATEDNLKLLEEQGYRYVCISRSKLKDYKLAEGAQAQTVLTRNRQHLTLQRVKTDRNTDYCLKVKSPGKALKESAMKDAFEKRFELELTKMKQGLSRKNSTKNIDSIHQRIGRAMQKYPSVSQYFQIEVSQNDQQQATNISWNKHPEKNKSQEDHLGTYFIRTNMDVGQEAVLWEIYNTIREIESSFRCLKTDLDLRPIYHKNDKSTMAHLHLGILAYWLVNTLRHQLKQKDIKDEWKEIVRKANTQKVITTSGKNIDNEVVAVRRCSEPNEPLQKIYSALSFKTHPFIKRKSVVHKPELKKHKNPRLLNLTSP